MSNLPYTLTYDLARDHDDAGAGLATTTKDTQGPVWRQPLTWVLFWPLLTLIARQTVYFAGPARDAATIQFGATRGAHLYIEVQLGFLLAFTVAGAKQTWAVLKENPALGALLLLAAASTLWSPAKQTTVQMSIEIALCSLFACYLSRRMATERLMSVLMLMGVITALLSIAFAVMLPSYGVFAGYTGGAWQGITNHKNSLGLAMAFLLTPALFDTRHGGGRKLCYSLLLLFLLYKSQSKGAWLDTAGMLLFVGWLYAIRRLRMQESLLLLLATVVVTLGLVIAGIFLVGPITHALGKDPTLNGRTVIYSLVWEAILAHPFLGYGFGGFWNPGSHESQFIGLDIGWPNIGYSENGFLELMLQIGFAGLALLLVMLGRAGIQAMRLLRSPFYTPRIGWFATILFLAMLTNIDAGWFMTWDILDWVLIIVACVGLNDATRQAEHMKLLRPSLQNAF